MYQPAGQLLGGLGGAAGAGSLGQSGRAGGGLFDLLAPLDYPRQSLYNLGRSAGKLFSGDDFGWDDVTAAAPGLLGGALALGSFGTAMPLAGLLTAGAGQALGKLSGRPEFEAAQPSALVGALGGDPESSWQNVLAGLATDPMTYTGLAGGARIGGNTANRIAAQGGMKPLLKGLIGGESGAADINKIIGLEGEPSLVESLLGRPITSRHGLPLPPSDAELAAGLAHQPRPIREFNPRQAGLLGGQDIDPAELTALLQNRFPAGSLGGGDLLKRYADFLPKESPGHGLGIIHDFEQEMLHGGLNMSPEQVLSTRAGLWDEALRSTGATMGLPESFPPLTLDEAKLYRMRHTQGLGEAMTAPLMHGNRESLSRLGQQANNQVSFGHLHDLTDPMAARPATPYDVFSEAQWNQGRGFQAPFREIEQQASSLYGSPFDAVLGHENLRAGIDPMEQLALMGYHFDPAKLSQLAQKGLRNGNLSGERQAEMINHLLRSNSSFLR